MDENHCQNYIMLYDVLSSNFNCMLRYDLTELLKCKFYFKIILQFFFDIFVDTLQVLSFLFQTWMHRVKMPSCGVLINIIHICISRFDMFCNSLCTCTIKFGYLVFLYCIMISVILTCVEMVEMASNILSNLTKRLFGKWFSIKKILSFFFKGQDRGSNSTEIYDDNPRNRRKSAYPIRNMHA